MSLHVLIAGAGLGGLALAHGLREAGIDATVFERDPTADHRPQGYRIHIDALGHDSLAQCLPTNLYELYVATSTRTPDKQVAMFFDHHFNKTGEGNARAGDFAADRAPTAVNRRTLREILLTGLGDSVCFGKAVTGFRTHASGVTALLSDGTSVDGDLLVAADGINSAVRTQLLPHVQIWDTGVRAVTGKTPLDNLGDDFPDELHNTFTGVHGPGYRTLALAEFRSRKPADEAAAELAPEAEVGSVPDYLMWLQLARVEDFPLSESEFWQNDPSALHRLASDMLEGWDPRLLRLVERTEVPATFPLAIRAVLPSEPWSPGRVTMMGDAIHAMAPIGGRGGNTALADAALLTKELRTSTASDPITAVGRYEEGMRERGREAVLASLRNSVPSIGASSPYDTGPAATEPMTTADSGGR